MLYAATNKDNFPAVRVFAIRKYDLKPFEFEFTDLKVRSVRNPGFGLNLLLKRIKLLRFVLEFNFVGWNELVTSRVGWDINTGLDLEA